MTIQLPNMLINVPDEFGRRAIKEQWSESQFLHEWTLMRIYEQLDKLTNKQNGLLPKPRIWRKDAI